MARSQLRCGIVGLPNVGKSTLFNALTAQQAPASNYPFCTIDPNVGIVERVDPRLQTLAQLSSSEKIVYATVSFVDIAGLVEGASKGEGLGNQFLAHIRETDAILHLVRCFEESDVVHVAGRVDPLNDIEVINLELILADLQMVHKSLAKWEKQAKNQRELQPKVELLRRVAAHLDAGQPLRTLEISEEEKELLSWQTFLSGKKVLYVANVGEEDLPSMENPYVEQVRRHAEKEGSSLVAICAKVEEEIAQLPAAEQPEFLSSLGLAESGLQRIIHTAFDLLGLITYLTTGEMETRAWTIPKGSTAVEAAGVIHSDIQEGFIRAETVAYEDLVAFGSRVAAREAGKVRAEGRSYLVRDGDVILFLHH